MGVLYSIVLLRLNTGGSLGELMQACDQKEPLIINSIPCFYRQPHHKILLIV